MVFTYLYKVTARDMCVVYLQYLHEYPTSFYMRGNAYIHMLCPILIL